MVGNMSGDVSQNIEFITPNWPAAKSVHAATTTRIGGFSQGAWQGLNLADHVGDDVENVTRNRELLSSALHLPAEPLWLKQVHGCEVLRATGDAPVDTINDTRGIECDASVTADSGRVCAVLTADCLPLLFCSNDGDCVAAAHAGWRGLAAGIIEQTVEQFACTNDQILAWLGPAIGPTAFEVGDDVYEVFTGAYDAGESAFTPYDDKWLCDIYQLARDRLRRLGVEKIYGGDYCTFNDPARFYSYRRDGISGRMASLIWIE